MGGNRSSHCKSRKPDLRKAGQGSTDGEVFWGQDRIELLADALKLGRGPIGL
jgi:hypothetical protein